jgi:hypothetical protein
VKRRIHEKYRTKTAAEVRQEEASAIWSPASKGIGRDEEMPTSRLALMQWCAYGTSLVASLGTMVTGTLAAQVVGWEWASIPCLTDTGVLVTFLFRTLPSNFIFLPASRRILKIIL